MSNETGARSDYLSGLPFVPTESTENILNGSLLDLLRLLSISLGGYYLQLVIIHSEYSMNVLIQGVCMKKCALRPSQECPKILRIWIKSSIKSDMSSTYDTSRMVFKGIKLNLFIQSVLFLINDLSREFFRTTFFVRNNRQLGSGKINIPSFEWSTNWQS